MYNNFRVIVSGNSGDGFHFRIEDVDPKAGFDETTGREYGPFVLHGVDGSQLCTAGSVGGLKAKLREMIRACDKKPLYMTRPKLQEWQLKEWR